MPVAAAIVGASVIGAGASIIGSSKAAGAARDAASQNNALQSQIYNQNTQNLTPWMQRGNAAGAQQAALLGLPGPQTQQPSGFVYNPQTGQFGYAPPQAQPDATAAARNAFNQFQNSDGYQFRFNQGLNTVNNNLATKGALNSGAALKALNDYAQGTASNEFGKYMGYLDNLDQRGMAAGSAIAGVGQNYANAVGSNNNNAASASGNASIAAANGINGVVGAGLNAFGMTQGFGSSYGGGGFNPGLSNYMTDQALAGIKMPTLGA